MEEGLQKKPCIKCLLKDIDPVQYETRIKKLIDLMDKSEKADNKAYEKRLQICSRCSYLKDAFCGACGCYVELRCVKKNASCPYDHW
jgi:hypothetical protein